MESDSVVDVTEDDSNEQYVEQDQSEEREDKNNMSDTGKYLYVLVFSTSCSVLYLNIVIIIMYPCLATDVDQPSLFTNPLFTSPLYYTAAAQLAALQAQSIQLAQLQTFINPIWLPPFVWPNLNSLYSTVTGNQVNGINSLCEKQHLNGVNENVRKEVGSESFCSAVKCSVVKTTGYVDKRNQFCKSLNSKATFCVNNLVKTL